MTLGDEPKRVVGPMVIILQLNSEDEGEKLLAVRTGDSINIRHRLSYPVPGLFRTRYVSVERVTRVTVKGME